VFRARRQLQVWLAGEERSASSLQKPEERVSRRPGVQQLGA